MVKASRGLVIISHINALVVPAGLEGLRKGGLAEIGSLMTGGQLGVVVGVMDKQGVGWSALGNQMRCMIWIRQALVFMCTSPRNTRVGGSIGVGRRLISSGKF
jgi:hypothetical protein